MTDITPEQTKHLKQRLQQRYNALRNEIRDILLKSEEQHYIDLAGTVHDSGEESVADLLADLGIAAVDRHVTELRAIEAALQRINMGSYAMCSDCGGEITYARLNSYPTAVRCVSCQTQREKSFVQAGTPTL